MALTLEQINAIPVAPNDSKAIAGKDTLLYVELAKDNWVLFGGQKNSPVTQKADTLDASDKTSGGWKKQIPGLKEWSIEYDGLYVLNDIATSIVEQAFLKGLAIHVRVEYANGSYKQGYAYVTEFSDSNAHDAIQTLKVSFNGYGEISTLVEVGKPNIASATGTFQKASAKDVTVKVTPVDATIRALKNEAGISLVYGTDYELVAGDLKIKKEYLTNLTGSKAVLTAKFANVEIPITITIS